MAKKFSRSQFYTLSTSSCKTKRGGEKACKRWKLKAEYRHLRGGKKK